MYTLSFPLWVPAARWRPDTMGLDAFNWEVVLLLLLTVFPHCKTAHTSLFESPRNVCVCIIHVLNTYPRHTLEAGRRECSVIMCIFIWHFLSILSERDQYRDYKFPVLSVNRSRNPTINLNYFASIIFASQLERESALHVTNVSVVYGCSAH